MEGPAALILARWAFFTAAAVAFGSALFPFYALHSGERAGTTGAWQGRRHRRRARCAHFAPRVVRAGRH